MLFELSEDTVKNLYKSSYAVSYYYKMLYLGESPEAIEKHKKEYGLAHLSENSIQERKAREIGTNDKNSVLNALGYLFDQELYRPSKHVLKHAVDLRVHKTGEYLYENYTGPKYREYIDGIEVRHLTLPR